MKPTRSKIGGDPVSVPVDLQPLLARHLMLPCHEVAAARVHRHETVAEFVARQGWQFRLPTICVVNGAPVLRADWAKHRIKASDQVCFISKPWGKSGGGAKQIIGMVALITLSVFAPGIGTAIGGALGLPATIFGVATGTLIGAGITLGGALLVNALVAPKPGGQNDAAAFAAPDPIYSVSASGNVGKPLQPIPVNYGRLKRFPDFAATPWSEFVGNDQYLNVLLSVGCGKYDVEQLFIDDTAFWDAVDGYNPEFPDITVALYGPGENIDLFPINITQAVEVSGQELPDPAVPPTPGWIGGFIANAAGSTAQSLAVDLVCPGGCYTVTGEGGIGSRSVQIIAEARKVDAAGAPITSYATIINQTYTFATRNPQRITEKVDVDPGRYEVRVRRGSAPLGGTAGVDGFVWAGLRAFLSGPSSFAGVSTVALRLKATAQLNANSAKRFGVLATRILPVWNGSTFVETATRNSYWAFYDAATNTDYGARRPVSKIDFQNLVDGAAASAARGDTFDYSFAQISAIPQAFDTILKSTRARHRWSGDVLTTVRDEWRAVPEMLLTDREIIRGSLSVDWLFNTEDSADSVILEYLDGETWRPAEVQYPPDSEDFTATNPARTRLDGVTDRDHAYREAAFFYLQSQMRRTNITLDTEHDGRRLGFGSAVRVQSELPQSWGATGVVTGQDENILTLDPAPVWADSGQHYIGLRDKCGRLFGPVKCSIGDDDSLAVLDPIDLAAVEADAGRSLSDARHRADGADDPSFAFGVGSTWSRPCVVVSGRPNGDLVTVALFVDDPGVHDTDLGDVASIPARPDLVDEKAPQIAGLYASFKQGIAEPTIFASWWAAPGAFYYLGEVSYDSGNSWSPLYEGGAASFSRPVDLAALRLRVAAVGARRGAWVYVDLDAPTISIDKVHLSIDVQNTLESVPLALERSTDALRTLVDPTVESALDLAGGDAALGALLKVQAERSERIAVVTAIESGLDDLNTGLGAKALASDVLLIQTALDDPILGLSALAAKVTTLTAQVGTGYSQSITIGAVVTNLYATYSIVLDVDGHAGGLVLNNSGAGVTLSFKGDLIVDGTITGAKIAALTVEAGNIKAGAITATKISAGAVTAGKIDAGAVNATNLLANNVVVTGHLVADAATYLSLSSGSSGQATLSDVTITSQSVPVVVGNAIWIYACLYLYRDPATVIYGGLDYSPTLISVYRGATLIDSLTVQVVGNTFLSVVDTGVAPGTYTYSFKIRSTTAFLNRIDYSYVRMTVLESRR